MTNDKIKTLALSLGFTERPQENGEMDLNPYVYESHKKAYDIGFTEGSKHSDWVSCNELLPEHGKKCLVVNSVEMLVGLYDRNLKEWFCGEIRSGWNIIDGVTHWAELPQPPSEVQP